MESLKGYGDIFEKAFLEIDLMDLGESENLNLKIEKTKELTKELLVKAITDDVAEKFVNIFEDCCAAFNSEKVHISEESLQEIKDLRVKELVNGVLESPIYKIKNDLQTPEEIKDYLELIGVEGIGEVYFYHFVRGVTDERTFGVETIIKAEEGEELKFVGNVNPSLEGVSGAKKIVIEDVTSDRWSLESGDDSSLRIEEDSALSFLGGESDMEKVTFNQNEFFPMLIKLKEGKTFNAPEKFHPMLEGEDNINKIIWRGNGSFISEIHTINEGIKNPEKFHPALKGIQNIGVISIIQNEDLGRLSLDVVSAVDGKKLMKADESEIIFSDFIDEEASLANPSFKTTLSEIAFDMRENICYFR